MRGKGRGSWNAAVVPVYTRRSVMLGYLCIYVEHRRTSTRGKDRDGCDVLSVPSKRERERERRGWRRANGQPRCAALLVRGSE